MSINNKPTFADALINLISSTFKTYLPVIILVLIGIIGGVFYRNYEANRSLQRNRQLSATISNPDLFNSDQFNGWMFAERINNHVRLSFDNKKLDILAQSEAEYLKANSNIPDSTSTQQKIIQAVGPVLYYGQDHDTICSYTTNADEELRFKNNKVLYSNMIDYNINAYGVGYVAPDKGSCNGYFVIDFAGL